MKERKSERPLWLTEEEALGLLDIVLVAPEELTPEQRAAVAKLSEFCRQYLRNSEETALPAHASLAPTSVTAAYLV